MSTTNLISDSEQNKFSDSSAIQWLRSITFVLNEDATGALMPNVDLTTQWLKQYQEWFVQAIGLHENIGQHLLYNREITFLGNSLLKQADSLRQMASTSLALGFSNSITVEAGHALSHEQAFESLLTDHCFHSIGFIITPECIKQPQHSVLNLLEKTAGYPISLGIIGDIKTLLDLKLMSSNVLNREDLTWSPMPFSLDSNIPHAVDPVRACHGRLQLYIDQFGGIYPCAGLMGLEAFRLGSMSEPFEETLFTDPTVMTEIQTWAEKGPDLEGTIQPHASVSELNQMCSWHLAHVTSS